MKWLRLRRPVVWAAALAAVSIKAVMMARGVVADILRSVYRVLEEPSHDEVIITGWCVCRNDCRGTGVRARRHGTGPGRPWAAAAGRTPGVRQRSTRLSQLE